MTYSVKNVKSITGHDGACFEASLYEGDKRVAIVAEDTWGGPTNFHWLDDKDEKVDVTVKHYNGNLHIYKGTPAEARFSKHVLEIDQDREVFVCSLVHKFEEEKQLRKWCNKETLFRLKGDKEGSWRTVKSKFSPNVVNWIRNKYTDQVEEILNDRFINPT